MNTTSSNTRGTAPAFDKDTLTTERTYDKSSSTRSSEPRSSDVAGVMVQSGAAQIATSGIQRQDIQTTTTSTTTLAPTLMQMPLSINEDVTKEYMPVHNTDTMKELITRMERAALEIDTYAKAKQELVSKEAVDLINEEMTRSKALQDGLNTTLQTRCSALDSDFARRREAMMRELDAEKAAQFVALQTDLQKQQEQIMLQSRARIDEITQKAKAKKLEIVHAAQQQHNSMSTSVTDSATMLQPTDAINQVSVSKEELRPTGQLSTGTTECTTQQCSSSTGPCTSKTSTCSKTGTCTSGTGPVLSRDGRSVGKY